MFKLVAFACILAVAAAAPGGVVVAHVAHAAPVAVSHQSSHVVHHAPVVKTVVSAPLVKTVVAAPVAHAVHVAHAVPAVSHASVVSHHAAPVVAHHAPVVAHHAAVVAPTYVKTVVPAHQVLVHH